MQIEQGFVKRQRLQFEVPDFTARELHHAVGAEQGTQRRPAGEDDPDGVALVALDVRERVQHAQRRGEHTIDVVDDEHQRLRRPRVLDRYHADHLDQFFVRLKSRVVAELSQRHREELARLDAGSVDQSHGDVAGEPVGETARDRRFAGRLRSVQRRDASGVIERLLEEIQRIFVRAVSDRDQRVGTFAKRLIPEPGLSCRHFRNALLLLAKTPRNYGTKAVLKRFHSP